MNAADFPKWFLGRMKAVAPSLFYRGIYEYRVVSAGSDGRLDIEPTDPDEELSEESKVEVWAGIAGYKVKPVAGTVVLVAFVKGDLRKPRVVGFCPLNYTKPEEMQVDGDSILLGTSGHKSVAREGDTVATMTAPAGPLIVQVANGSVWQLQGVNSGGAVVFSIIPVTNPGDAGKLILYSDSKVKAE